MADVLKRWEEREEAEREARRVKEVHVPGDFADIATAVRKSKAFNRIVVHRGHWTPPAGEAVCCWLPNATLLRPIVGRIGTWTSTNTLKLWVLGDLPKKEYR